MNAQHEEFLVAVCTASTAILQLITILLSSKFPKDKVDESKEVLDDIINDLRFAINESEFAASHMVKHIEHLSKLSKIL